MNIHEYQGKEILKKYGVAVQRGIVADTLDNARLVQPKNYKSETGTKWFVIKSQIHAGGRGKGT
jgi:succinyl-CoA synthetase beta subunit